MIIIFISFSIFISFKYFLSIDDGIGLNENLISNIDITEPRFAIEGKNQKILVTAKQGNFMDDNKILLEKDVLFKSKNFSIMTDKVVFDRIKKNAYSKSEAVFKSSNTRITSEGFDIYDNGNKIKFIGNSVLVLK